MSQRAHHYAATVRWTGNTGKGTTSYRAYARDHIIEIDGKPAISGSSDPAFRGAVERHNPEDLLVASLSACHMLWYLHLCSEAGVIVVGYEDRASGTMVETTGGGGHFESVTLAPRVTITRSSSAACATELHHAAHAKCFIANSVNFPVSCRPEILIEP